jgi:hypothetical protein
MKKVLSFVRWRIIGLRYLTMFFNIRWLARKKNYRPSLNATQDILEHGFHQPRPIAREVIDRIMSLYQPRTAKVVQRETGAPFVNLMQDADITADNPVMKLAFSKEIFDVATDYFGGHLIMDSIQVLYSWPTSGKLRESQMWHKDYGDSKSFHAIIYLNDVLDEKDGPFVFIDKKDTRKIGLSPFVRRIADSRFAKELGTGKIRIFKGKAGDMVMVDPATCYHYGSRCSQPRLAIFITFNTSMPFVPPQSIIENNQDRLVEVAKKIRPDLSPAFIARVIGNRPRLAQMHREMAYS